MSAHDPLPLLLRGLNLPHAAREHAAALARAEAENWGYRRFLLHLVEGEIHPPSLPVTPGHQAVAEVEALGEGVSRLAIGQRVGAAWLAWACPPGWRWA